MHGLGYFDSTGEGKMGHVDANVLIGVPMAQPLPYAVNDFDENTSLGTLLATKVIAGIGYSVEVHLKYLDIMKQKRYFFPFCPECEKVDVSSFTDYMKYT